MKKLIFVLSVLCSMLFSLNVLSDDINEDINGSWIVFYYNGDPRIEVVEAEASLNRCTLAYGDVVAAGDPPWTLDVGDGGATVTVLTGYNNIAQFGLYDYGELVGITSEPPLPVTFCGIYPDLCLLDPDQSKGFFPLSPGHHSLTIRLEAVYGIDEGNSVIGCAWFRVDAAITETEVEIDIQPNKTTNKVRLDDDRVVTVAILTSSDFNALTVDTTTIRFGPAEALPIERLTRAKDVDRDGDKDYMFRFIVSETGILCGDTEATLTGKTLEGESIKGTDSITTVRCEPVTVVDGVIIPN